MFSSCPFPSFDPATPVLVVHARARLRLAFLNRLLELAWETYNDPPDFTNPNNYHFGIANFERVGFELVAHIFNAQHDTHCFVLQDKPRAVSSFPRPPPICPLAIDIHIK